MSQGVPPQQDAAGGKDNAQRVRKLLEDALRLIDASPLPPEIGARLQEVIDAVAAHTDAAASDGTGDEETWSER